MLGWRAGRCEDAKAASLPRCWSASGMMLLSSLPAFCRQFCSPWSTDLRGEGKEPRSPRSPDLSARPKFLRKTKGKGLRISESAGPGLTEARRHWTWHLQSMCRSACVRLLRPERSNLRATCMEKLGLFDDLTFQRLQFAVTARTPTLRMAEMGLSRALGSPNGALRGPQLYGWKLYT